MLVKLHVEVLLNATNWHCHNDVVGITRVASCFFQHGYISSRKNFLTKYGFHEECESALPFKSDWEPTIAAYKK